MQEYSYRGRCIDFCWGECTRGTRCRYVHPVERKYFDFGRPSIARGRTKEKIEYNERTKGDPKYIEDHYGDGPSEVLGLPNPATNPTPPAPASSSAPGSYDFAQLAAAMNPGGMYTHEQMTAWMRSMTPEQTAAWHHASGVNMLHQQFPLLPQPSLPSAASASRVHSQANPPPLPPSKKSYGMTAADRVAAAKKKQQDEINILVQSQQHVNDNWMKLREFVLQNGGCVTLAKAKKDLDDDRRAASRKWNLITELIGDAPLEQFMADNEKRSKLVGVHVININKRGHDTDAAAG